MLLEVRQKTGVHFLVGRGILGFLSIFKKIKASSPFEALNSVYLSRCQREVMPLSRWGGDIRLYIGYPQGIQTCLHLVRWKTSLNFSHCTDIRSSLSQGHSGSIPLETENTRSLSHTYCWGKTPLEVLVVCWLTFSDKDRESALILRWYGVHGAFHELLYWNSYSYKLETGVSGNLCSFLNAVKPLVLYDVEHGIAMQPKKGKWASSRVDFWYTKLFAFLRWHQCFSRLVTVFLGNSWCSTKQIKASYVFDLEHEIALHAMQGNRVSSHGEGNIS